MLGLPRRDAACRTHLHYHSSLLFSLFPMMPFLHDFDLAILPALFLTFYLCVCVCVFVCVCVYLLPSCFFPIELKVVSWLGYSNGLKSYLGLSTGGRGEGIMKGLRTANMVEVFYIHV
jgi:hypothetical protein